MDRKEIEPVSRHFKIWTVVFTVLVTAIQVVQISYFSQNAVVPDWFLLALALIMIVYLWGQERRAVDLREAATRELREAHQRLKDANIKAMKALVLIEEARDTYTRGHCERVGRYSVAIAQKIGLPENEIEHLRRACLLHDIGKISIDGAVLRKKERLTEEEWIMIKRHPDIGAEVIAPFEFLAKEKEIVRYHHERYGGGGYPEGRRGEAIPLGARIIGLVDAFDAMNSDRPYRTRLSREKIFSELEKSSGTQFDPKIAQVFVSLLKTDESFWKR